MSILSNLFKNKTIKIGTVLLGSKFAGEYLFGDTTYTAFGDPVYKGGNFFGDALAKTGITPFQETAIGKGFLGDAINLFKPGSMDNSLAGTVMQAATSGSRMQMPQAPQYAVASGSQGFSGRQNFQASQTQMMRLGNGGAVTAALGRDATQQYLARKIAGLRLPTASPLPTPMSASGTIATSAGRRSSYQKLTGAR